jgi:hypothetical protein
VIFQVERFAANWTTAASQYYAYPTVRSPAPLRMESARHLLDGDVLLEPRDFGFVDVLADFATELVH